MTKKTLAILLAVFFALAMPVAAFADEYDDAMDEYYSVQWPDGIPYWADYIDSIMSVGSEPSASLKLTPRGYVFTDWTLPDEFYIVFVNGSAVNYKVTEKKEFHTSDYFFGETVGYYFDIEIDGVTLTLCAQIDYLSLFFELYQHVDPESNADGFGTDEFIAQEECALDIDGGNVFTRIAYAFYRMFAQLRFFFEELKYMF